MERMNDSSLAASFGKEKDPRSESAMLHDPSAEITREAKRHLVRVDPKLPLFHDTDAISHTLICAFPTYDVMKPPPVTERVFAVEMQDKAFDTTTMEAGVDVISQLQTQLTPAINRLKDKDFFDGKENAIKILRQALENLDSFSSSVNPSTVWSVYRIAHREDAGQAYFGLTNHYEIVFLSKKPKYERGAAIHRAVHGHRPASPTSSIHYSQMPSKHVSAAVSQQSAIGREISASSMSAMSEQFPAGVDSRAMPPMAMVKPMPAFSQKPEEFEPWVGFPDEEAIPQKPEELIREVDSDLILDDIIDSRKNASESTMKTEATKADDEKESEARVKDDGSKADQWPAISPVKASPPMGAPMCAPLEDTSVSDELATLRAQVSELRDDRDHYKNELLKSRSELLKSRSECEGVKKRFNDLVARVHVLAKDFECVPESLAHERLRSAVGTHT